MAAMSLPVWTRSEAGGVTERLHVLAPPSLPRGAAPLLALADDVCDTLADALHDGPLQAVLAARLHLQRQADPAPELRVALDEALSGLRAAMSAARSGTGRAGPAHDLQALAAQFPLQVTVDGADPGAPAGLFYRLAQALAVDAVAHGARTLRLRLYPDAAGHHLTGAHDGDCAVPPHPALRRRVAAATAAGLRAELCEAAA